MRQVLTYETGYTSSRSPIYNGRGGIVLYQVSNEKLQIKRRFHNNGGHITFTTNTAVAATDSDWPNMFRTRKLLISNWWVSVIMCWWILLHYQIKIYRPRSVISMSRSKGIITTCSPSKSPHSTKWSIIRYPSYMQNFRKRWKTFDFF